MNKLIANNELESYLKKLLNSDFRSFIDVKHVLPAIRINTLKTTQKDFLTWIRSRGQDLQPLSFSSLAYTMREDSLPLSHTLAFFMGHFQYQGASSQIPVLLLNPKPDDRVLDMTAAPGSKSTQIAACMQNRGELVINDWSHQRLQPLNANLQRSGALNYYILNLRGESLGNLFFEYFDRILVDAPCSALGTLPENREVYYWWRYDRLKKLTRIQSQLLISAVKALKPGGELVYSTCSIAPEENEYIIEQLCRSYPVEVVPPPADLADRFSRGWGNIGESPDVPHLKYALRIWPQLHGFEGFYAIKLRKTDSPVKKKPSELKFAATLTINDAEIEEIISRICEEWGIPKAFFTPYRYKLSKNRIWMAGPEVVRYPYHRFVSAGLLLAERKLYGWKIPSNASQVLNRFISKKIITLDDEQLKLLFANAELLYEGIKPGYYVFKQKADIIGTVYSDGRQIKTRLPHIFNLQI